MKLHEFNQALLLPTLIGTTRRKSSLAQSRILARLWGVALVSRGIVFIVGSSNHGFLVS